MEIDEIKGFCKTEQWSDFLDKVADYIEYRGFAKEKEAVINMLPYEQGIMVSIVSNPVIITQKVVVRTFEEIEKLKKQTLLDYREVKEVRSVHIWWAEIEAFIAAEDKLQIDIDDLSKQFKEE